MYSIHINQTHIYLHVMWFEPKLIIVSRVESLILILNSKYNNLLKSF